MDKTVALTIFNEASCYYSIHGVVCSCIGNPVNGRLIFNATIDIMTIWAHKGVSFKYLQITYGLPPSSYQSMLLRDSNLQFYLMQQSVALCCIAPCCLQNSLPHLWPQCSAVWSRSLVQFAIWHSILPSAILPDQLNSTCTSAL